MDSGHLWPLRFAHHLEWVWASRNGGAQNRITSKTFQTGSGHTLGSCQWLQLICWFLLHVMWLHRGLICFRFFFFQFEDLSPAPSLTCCWNDWATTILQSWNLYNVVRGRICYQLIRKFLMGDHYGEASRQLLRNSALFLDQYLPHRVQWGFLLIQR